MVPDHVHDELANVLADVNAALVAWDSQRQTQSRLTHFTFQCIGDIVDIHNELVAIHSMCAHAISIIISILQPYTTNIPAGQQSLSVGALNHIKLFLETLAANIDNMTQKIHKTYAAIRKGELASRGPVADFQRHRNMLLTTEVSDAERCQRWITPPSKSYTNNQCHKVIDGTYVYCSSDSSVSSDAAEFTDAEEILGNDMYAIISSVAAAGR